MGSVQESIMKTVQYKSVVGFPDYRIGDDGSLWSRMKRGRRWGRNAKDDVCQKWRLLRGGTHSGGYKQVGLRKDGERFQVCVHKLVLEAFIGPCPVGMEACHAPDRNPANNHLENLRWDTRSNNQIDSVHDGTHGSLKLTESQVREIYIRAHRGENQRQIAKEFGISAGHVNHIKKGRY